MRLWGLFLPLAVCGYMLFLIGYCMLRMAGYRVTAEIIERS